MAEDDIQIDIKSDTSQGEKAAQVIQEMSDRADQLSGKLDKARDAQGRFVAGSKDVADEAGKTATAIEQAADRSVRATEKAAAFMLAAQAKEVARIRADGIARRAAADALAEGRRGSLGSPIVDPTPILPDSPGRTRLAGKERAAAMTRLGMFTANTAQDMIQGGPASGVNNILGAAGDGGIKALLGEGVAAAGGIGAIATAFASVAVAAGAAFLVIDGGLKSAKLGWSDLDDVIANLGPIHAAGEALAGIGTIVTDVFAGLADTTIGAAAIAAVDSIGQSIYTAVSFVDSYTLGWGQATEAARAHKAELEGSVRAAREYSDAMKELGKFQSKEEKAKEATGKLVGQELADLGGAGGIEGLASRLAEKATKVGAEDKVKIRQTVKDKNGKDTDETEEVEVTRREAARRRILTDLNAAKDGDPNAIGRTTAALKGAGLETSGFLDATNGVDKKEVEKEKAKKDKARAAEVEKANEDSEKEIAEAEKAHAAKAKKLADPLQDRYDRLAGAGKEVTAPEVAQELKNAGMNGAAAKAMAPDVLASLKQGYEDAVSKKAGETGLGRDDAAKEMAKDNAEKDKDKADREKGKADRLADKPEKDKEKAERDADKAKRDAIEKADKATRGTGLDARGQQAAVMSMLRGGTQEEVVGRISAGLKSELLGKGMGSEEAGIAAQSKAEEWAGKLGDELVAKSMEGPEPLRAAERINVGSFAASVESAGADSMKRAADGIDEMKNRLAELVRIQGRGPRLAP